MLVRNRTTRLSCLRNLKMSNKQKSPKDFNINNPECNSGYKHTGPATFVWTVG